MATYTFCKLISTSNGEDANRDTLGAAQNHVQPAAGQVRGLQRGHAAQLPHRLHVRPAVRQGKALLNNMPTVLKPFSATGRSRESTPMFPARRSGSVAARTSSEAAATRAAALRQEPPPAQIPLINPDWTWSHDNIGTTALGRIPYLNPAAFVLPANMTYGDTPRQMSYLRRPWSVNEDLAILKNFSSTNRPTWKSALRRRTRPTGWCSAARTPRKAAPISAGSRARATARAPSSSAPGSRSRLPATERNRP